MHNVRNDTETNIFLLTDKVFTLVVLIFTHDALLDDPLLYLLQQNINAILTIIAMFFTAIIAMHYFNIAQPTWVPFYSLELVCTWLKITNFGVEGKKNFILQYTGMINKQNIY